MTFKLLLLFLPRTFGKYASKAEMMSSVVKTPFTSVVNKLTDSSDVHSSSDSPVGNRDYCVQEVTHHLLSLKSVSSSI